MPRTPFSTSLSRSARETELRLRNIFSGPKKRPPVLFLALVFAMCLLCGNLVSCQTAEAEEKQTDASAPAPLAPEQIPEFDLNQNGVPEEVRLAEPHGWTEVQFWEGGELIDRETPGVCVYSYCLGGPDHILRCSLREYQGCFDYQYSVSDFSGEFEDAFLWDQVSFDINFNTPYHKSFDPEEIAGFVDELNELFAHSVRLSEAGGELVLEHDLTVELDWLDSFPEVFTRDPEKSLAENLADFQQAMIQAQGPAPAGVPSALPFDEPLTLDFYSGAGAWGSRVVLSPDGTFTGDYSDTDAYVIYVCQFHGSLGDIAQLSDHSWSLTLEELVLDTKYPMGREWDEGEYHYISSGPAGFSDDNNDPLPPGARFILYSPEATGHQPGTELYGAAEFQSWAHTPREFRTASDTLGCWGLHDLTTGIGFFAD